MIATVSVPMIRPAGPSDLARVEAIVAAAYTPWVARIGRRPAPMDDDYARLIEAGHVQVLWQGDVAVGVLVLIPEAETLLLDNIAVDTGHRGQGLGRVLLDHAEAQARRLGFAAIRLYTNAKMTENIAIYARRGYLETHRAEEKGLHRVFMTKRLAVPDTLGETS